MHMTPQQARNWLDPPLSPKQKQDLTRIKYEYRLAQDI